MPELLTVADAAKRLCCSPATVYALCTALKLRHARVGTGRGAIRVPTDAIEEYIASTMTGPSPKMPEPVRRGPLELSMLKIRGRD
jgi:excisionase family DNA binding protein